MSTRVPLRVGNHKVFRFPVNSKYSFPNDFARSVGVVMTHVPELPLPSGKGKLFIVSR